MENKNLKYKCLIADEKIEQLQKENRKLREKAANMHQVNSGGIFFSWKRLTFIFQKSVSRHLPSIPMLVFKQMIARKSINVRKPTTLSEQISLFRQISI